MKCLYLAVAILGLLHMNPAHSERSSVQLSGSRAGDGPVNIKGRVMFEGSSPTGLSRLIIFAWEATQESLWRQIEIGRAPNIFPQAAVGADGTFELLGLKAETQYALQVGRIPRGWWLASATEDVNGERTAPDDLLDLGLRTRVATFSMPVITLRFVDWQTILTGKVVLQESKRPEDYVVVVAPVEARLWRRPSRRIRTARMTPTAEFRIEGLPTGTYIVQAFLTSEFAPGDLYEPSFLARVAERGQRVTLKDRTPQIVTLR